MHSPAASFDKGYERINVHQTPLAPRDISIRNHRNLRLVVFQGSVRRKNERKRKLAFRQLRARRRDGIQSAPLVARVDHDSRRLAHSSSRRKPDFWRRPLQVERIRRETEQVLCEQRRSASLEAHVAKLAREIVNRRLLLLLLGIPLLLAVATRLGTGVRLSLLVRKLALGGESRCEELLGLRAIGRLRLSAVPERLLAIADSRVACAVVCLRLLAGVLAPFAALLGVGG